MQKEAADDGSDSRSSGCNLLDDAEVCAALRAVWERLHPGASAAECPWP